MSTAVQTKSPAFKPTSTSVQAKSTAFKPT
jgi:hypothetical protein